MADAWDDIGQFFGIPKTVEELPGMESTYSTEGYDPQTADYLASLGRSENEFYGQSAQQAEGRGAQSALLQSLLAQSRGEGPSVAQMQYDAAKDASARAAASAAAGQRGGNPRAAARQILDMQNQANLGATRDSAMIKFQEQMSAQQQLAALASAQRGQDLQSAGQMGTMYGMNAQGMAGQNQNLLKLEELKQRTAGEIANSRLERYKLAVQQAAAKAAGMGKLSGSLMNAGGAAGGLGQNMLGGGGNSGSSGNGGSSGNNGGFEQPTEMGDDTTAGDDWGDDDWGDDWGDDGGDDWGDEGYAEGGEVKDHFGFFDDEFGYARGGFDDGLAGGYADGGVVPGRAPLPGDNDGNDIVPARVEPGQVIIPRSVATAPNAPQRAKQYMTGLRSNGKVGPDGVRRFAEGGGLESDENYDVEKPHGEGRVGEIVDADWGNDAAERARRETVYGGAWDYDKASETDRRAGNAADLAYREGQGQWSKYAAARAQAKALHAQTLARQLPPEVQRSIALAQRQGRITARPEQFQQTPGIYTRERQLAEMDAERENLRNITNESNRRWLGSDMVDDAKQAFLKNFGRLDQFNAERERLNKEILDTNYRAANMGKDFTQVKAENDELAAQGDVFSRKAYSGNSTPTPAKDIYRGPFLGKTGFGTSKPDPVAPAAEEKPGFARGGEVDAVLSPEEIVVPARYAQGGDAPEKTARYVQSVKRSGKQYPKVMGEQERLAGMLAPAEEQEDPRAAEFVEAMQFAEGGEVEPTSSGVTISSADESAAASDALALGDQNLLAARSSLKGALGMAEGGAVPVYEDVPERRGFTPNVPPEAPPVNPDDEINWNDVKNAYLQGSFSPTGGLPAAAEAVAVPLWRKHLINPALDKAASYLGPKGELFARTAAKGLGAGGGQLDTFGQTPKGRAAYSDIEGDGSGILDKRMVPYLTTDGMKTTSLRETGLGFGMGLTENTANMAGAGAAMGFAKGASSAANAARQTAKAKYAEFIKSQAAKIDAAEGMTRVPAGKLSEMEGVLSKQDELQRMKNEDNFSIAPEGKTLKDLPEDEVDKLMQMAMERRRRLAGPRKPAEYPKMSEPPKELGSGEFELVKPKGTETRMADPADTLDDIASKEKTQKHVFRHDEAPFYDYSKDPGLEGAPRQARPGPSKRGSKRKVKADDEVTVPEDTATDRRLLRGR